MALKEMPFWLDHLFEKHECFPYDKHVKVPAKLSGRDINIIVPEYLPTTTIVQCVEIGSALFAIGQSSEKYRDEAMGVMLLAKPHDANTYETVVWHEVFPRAYKRLGLIS